MSPSETIETLRRLRTAYDASTGLAPSSTVVHVIDMALAEIERYKAENSKLRARLGEW